MERALQPLHPLQRWPQGSGGTWGHLSPSPCAPAEAESHGDLQFCVSPPSPCPRPSQKTLFSAPSAAKNPIWVCFRGTGAPHARDGVGPKCWGARGGRCAQPGSDTVHLSPSRPFGRPVQNVSPSTTSTVLLSRTCPSAKEMSSPLSLSPRYGHHLPPVPSQDLHGMLGASLCRTILHLPCRWDPLVPMEVPQSQQGRNRAMRSVN